MSSKPGWAGLLSEILSQSLKANPEGTSCQEPTISLQLWRKKRFLPQAAQKAKHGWNLGGEQGAAFERLGDRVTAPTSCCLEADSSGDAGKGHCTADTLRFTLQTSK